MKSLSCGWAAVFLVCLFSTVALAAPEWNKKEWDSMFKEGGALGRLAVRVVDDKGVPVAGAQVRGEFYSTPKPTSIEGRTGEDGLLEVEGRTISDVKFVISKDSYYQTNHTYDFIKRVPSKADALQDGKWMPWNPTFTVTLKKVRKPVPMFARQVGNVPLPCDQPVGFDLEIGDCVEPFGRGQRSDLILLVSRRKDQSGRDAYRWKLSFSNSSDGIQVMERDFWSRFPWAYEAPEGGYQELFAQPDSPASELDQSGEARRPYLVFRVRSKTDTDGRVISANYGKMYSQVLAGRSTEKGCGISFWYWFNPDGTRNLEFDPRRNLGTKRRSGDDLLYQP